MTLQTRPWSRGRRRSAVSLAPPASRGPACVQGLGGAEGSFQTQDLRYYRVWRLFSTIRRGSLQETLSTWQDQASGAPKYQIPDQLLSLGRDAVHIRADGTCVTRDKIPCGGGECSWVQECPLLLDTPEHRLGAGGTAARPSRPAGPRAHPAHGAAPPSCLYGPLLKQQQEKQISSSLYLELGHLVLLQGAEKTFCFWLHFQ